MKPRKRLYNQDKNVYDKYFKRLITKLSKEPV